MPYVTVLYTDVFVHTGCVDWTVENSYPYMCRNGGSEIRGHFQNPAYGRPQYGGAFFRYSVLRHSSNSRCC